MTEYSFISFDISNIGDKASEQEFLDLITKVGLQDAKLNDEFVLVITKKNNNQICLNLKKHEIKS